MKIVNGWKAGTVTSRKSLWGYARMEAVKLTNGGCPGLVESYGQESEEESLK
jgi:hypothetical protein